MRLCKVHFLRIAAVGTWRSESADSALCVDCRFRPGANLCASRTEGPHVAQTNHCGSAPRGANLILAARYRNAQLGSSDISGLCVLVLSRARRSRALQPFLLNFRAYTKAALLRICSGTQQLRRHNTIAVRAIGVSGRTPAVVQASEASPRSAGDSETIKAAITFRIM